MSAPAATRLALLEPGTIEPMTPEQFTAWLGHMAVSKTKAAELLGISRPTLYAYLSGVNARGECVEIPRSIALACAALRLGVRDYPGQDTPP